MNKVIELEDEEAEEIKMITSIDKDIKESNKKEDKKFRVIFKTRLINHIEDNEGRSITKDCKSLWSNNRRS